MKILDLYIVKNFFSTFLMMFLLFIPIGILVDISEKIDKFKEHDLTIYQVLDYYSDFIWYYGYSLVPIFVFLSSLKSYLKSMKCTPKLDLILFPSLSNTE